MATQTTPQEVTDLAASLASQGLAPTGKVHWNHVAPSLIQHAIRRDEGQLADMGPFVAVTAPHTGRSPNDKFVVKEPGSEKDVDWGKVNQPMTPEHFETLLADVQGYLDERDELFVQDLYCGADPKYRLAVRYVSPNAWHMAFVRNMFIRPDVAGAEGLRAELHRAARAGVPGRSGEARHAHRHVHRAQSRRAHDPHRRHALRRRAEEGDVHRHELLHAEAGRALHALLGEHRAGGRHGALLRPLRHGQDDALGGSVRARSSATTSTAGRPKERSTSRAAATRR